MKLTIDTSVALKLLLDEPGSSAAEALVESDSILIAPDLIHAEMANALWANALSKRIEPEQALALVSVWQPLLDTFYPVAGLAEDALRLALLLNHAIYDCIFLALAIREDAVLVTADGKFLKLLEGTAYAAHARALA
jgi:predicted nucleic acid-binding protein